MANVLGVHSVGSSIVTFLRNTYPGPGGSVHCRPATSSS